MTDISSQFKRVDPFLLIVIAVSLSVNLAQYARHLSSSKSVILPYTIAAGEMTPTAASKLQQLHLLQENGASVSLPFGPTELPVAVYVLSPKCGWCRLNVPNISALAEQEKGKYRIIGVSSTTDQLLDYVHKTPLPFPVYSADPRFINKTISLDITPRLLVFSPSGEFVRGWNGAFINKTGNDVATFFNVHLPR